jgi:hypothetical protein
VPPETKRVSGKVGQQQARRRLPTLTDGGEEGTNTETAPESVQEMLATTPLPGTVSAELVGSRGTYPLTTIRTLIGRGPDADIPVDNRNASRRHASIFYSGAEFRIRDEGSRHGTLLNGSFVVDEVIRDGDELTVGDIVMRFRIRRP